MDVSGICHFSSLLWGRVGWEIYTCMCFFAIKKINPWVEENSGYIVNQPLAPNGTNKGLIRPSLRLLSTFTPKILEEFPF